MFFLVNPQWKSSERERDLLILAVFFSFYEFLLASPKIAFFIQKIPSLSCFLGPNWRPDPMRQRLAIFFSLLLVTAAFSRLGQTPLAAPRIKSVAMAITVWTTEDAEDKVL